MNLRLPVIILFCFNLFLTAAFADQSDHKFTGGVDTAISEICTGGFWEKSDNYGYWRLIVRNVGWELTRSYLYLQWLKIDENDKQVLEFKTMPISEFNSGKWMNVQKVEYKNDAFQIQYIMRNHDGFGKAELKPELPGKYKIVFQK